MKIISWNVNGIRSVLNKGFVDFVKSTDADVIHIQEAKIDDEAFEKLNLQNILGDEYNVYYHLATRKKGYSGLITITKTLPSNIIKGIQNDKFDSEGRVLILEYPNFYLINSYFPNTSRDLSRLDFKQDFNEEILNKLNQLNKPLVISGDFNVAHGPIDIARPKQNEGNAGYTIEEREFFTKLLSNGYIDTFRHKNPDLIKYTWWLQGFSARERNVGWRIDYHVVSANLSSNIENADILTQIKGSDHCPILLDINL